MQRPITICFTYFRGLTPANLAAALYSVSRQDLSLVDSVVVVDNNTQDLVGHIQSVIDAQNLPVPVRLFSYKHGDDTRAQSWSTNVTVRHAETPWVFYTRADYLLDFNILAKFVRVLDAHPAAWDGFVVSNGCFLSSNIDDCEKTNWRATGPSLFTGVVYDYTVVDSGVWMARREMFDRVGGFDETLSAWGHAQTLFQYAVYQSGTEFVRVPEVLHWHVWHGGLRDIDVAHRQLLEHKGIDYEGLKKMWSRYHGRSPYQ
jgi:hypothetical protein